MNMQKMQNSGRGVRSGGGHGGCERRIEVIVKKQKKKMGGGGRGRGRGGVERGLVGSKVGVRGCFGVWGCEPRIEGIVQCT